ncbi:MAG TPA: NAD-dependent epimerase/dehydratase family protein [Candidatus Angelobacter sp.]|nr:NAD-dependent epimerase/dehydratase family protein [Candidatus Angelobacter sp.]
MHAGNGSNGGNGSHPARRVLVTGAAGFIGGHVTEALLMRGDEVVGLDNFDTFYDVAVKRATAARLDDGRRCRIVDGDIRDAALLDTLIGGQGVTHIVHLAARAGVRPSLRDPFLYQDVNIRGTLQILEAARRHQVNHVVAASSSSVYGAQSKLPFSESDHADHPSSPYAATKRSNELDAHVYHHIYGMDVTMLRFFTVYGPRQRPEMAIHRFTSLIDRGSAIEMYGDGTARRDYTYIVDIVDGVLRALDRPNGYRVYNLGATGTTPLLRLAEMLADLLEQPLRVRHLPDQPGDVPVTCADVSLAERELGYTPTTPIEVGLERFVSWFRRERYRMLASA